MLTLQKQFLIALFSVLTFPSIASSYDYDSLEAWPALCQNGKIQSPIPLTSKDALRREYSPLLFKGYNIPNGVVITNNGHTASCKLSDAETPNVQGGGLMETYALAGFHFHWRSEHTINGRRYPLELHLVHRSSNESDRFAVFAVMFHISPDDFEDIEPLIQAINDMDKQFNSRKEIKDFVVSSLLPKDRAGFYRYTGSLTTPGCDEGVTWTVFTNSLPISRRQVQAFESLLDAKGRKITSNYRILQPVNNRKIYLKPSPDWYEG